DAGAGGPEGGHEEGEALGGLARGEPAEVEHVGGGLELLAAPRVGVPVQGAVHRVGAGADGGRILGATDEHGAGGEVLGAGEEPVVTLHGLVDGAEAFDVPDLDGAPA